MRWATSKFSKEPALHAVLGRVSSLKVGLVPALHAVLGRVSSLKVRLVRQIQETSLGAGPVI